MNNNNNNNSSSDDNIDKQQYEKNKPNIQNNAFPFTIRNPIDAKYDCEKKERLTDINLFKQVQGGNIIHYSDNKPVPTRVSSYKIDDNNQLPAALPSNATGRCMHMTMVLVAKTDPVSAYIKSGRATESILSPEIDTRPAIQSRKKSLLRRTSRIVGLLA